MQSRVFVSVSLIVCVPLIYSPLLRFIGRLAELKLFSCDWSKASNYSLSERINFLISHKDV